MYQINTLSNFDHELKKLLKKYPSIGQDLKNLTKSLSENPFQGDGLGRDCYKVRMAIGDKNKGKSGGARVITYVKVVGETITLLSIYYKSEQADIGSNFLQDLLKESGLI